MYNVLTKRMLITTKHATQLYPVNPDLAPTVYKLAWQTMRFRLHSTYVNNLKEENPFCNIFLLWDTQKNMIKNHDVCVFY